MLLLLLLLLWLLLLSLLVLAATLSAVIAAAAGPKLLGWHTMLLPTSVAAELLTACLLNMCLMHLSAQAGSAGMLLVRHLCSGRVLVAGKRLHIIGACF